MGGDLALWGKAKREGVHHPSPPIFKDLKLRLGWVERVMDPPPTSKGG